MNQPRVQFGLPHIVSFVGVAVVCFVFYDALRGAAWRQRRVIQRRTASQVSPGSVPPVSFLTGSSGTGRMVQSAATPPPVAKPTPTPLPPLTAAPSVRHPEINRQLGYIPLKCLSNNSVMTLKNASKVYRYQFQRDFLENFGLTDEAMLLGLPGGTPLAPAVPGKPPKTVEYCMHHATVRFVPPVFGALPPIADFTTLTRCGLRDFIKGVSEGGVWREGPAGEAIYGVKGCELTPHLTRDAILAALRGRRIVFSGDSMVRQMYLRLVEMIRIDRPALDYFMDFAEHYFHNNSYYAANQTTDFLTVRTEFPEPDALPVSDPILEIFFVWDPRPQRYQKQPFTTLNPTDIVASHMYWWSETQPRSFIHNYVNAVRRFMKNRADVRFFYMTTPATHSSSFGRLKNTTRIARNKYVTDKFNGLRHPRVNMLDFSSFADRRHFPKTQDGLHYQCILRPSFPDPIAIEVSKIIDTGCSDVLNGNWVHVLIASLSAPLA